MADGPSLPARVLQSPRVGFGVTTLALVGLASAGTGLLVAHGTRQLQPPPARLAPPVATPPSLTPVLVDRAPGTLQPRAVRTVRTVRVVTTVTTPRQGPGPATVPPPVVQGPPSVPPPVTVPPVVVPPVVEPPVVTPSIGGKKPHPQHPVHPDDHGKHLGDNKHS